jgi:hypothetical protein
MDEAGSFEMLMMTYLTTEYHIPEDPNFSTDMFEDEHKNVQDR